MSSVPLVVDEVGEGPPLVILHGLFGSARNWQAIARQLATTRHVLAVDLRNHGRSPHADRHDYPALAADVAALLAARGLEDVTLLGHSMGGKAAMLLALTDGARLAKLVVVDIAPVAYADAHTPLIDALLALPLATIERRQQAESLLATAVPDVTLRLFLLQNLLFDNGQARWRLNLPVLRAAMPALIGALPVPDDARFARPVHFIRGALSDRVDADAVAASRSLFPSLTVHTVAGGGHWPHAEAPAAFMTCLGQALDA